MRLLNIRTKHLRNIKLYDLGTKYVDTKKSLQLIPFLLLYAAPSCNTHNPSFNTLFQQFPTCTPSSSKGFLGDPLLLKKTNKTRLKSTLYKYVFFESYV